MRSRLAIVLFFFLTVAFSCKRNKVKLSTIKGTVFNSLYNAPLGDYTVRLLESFDPKKNSRKSAQIRSTETKTDINGNFSFTDFEIHQSTEFSYELRIGPCPQSSGCQPGAYSYVDGSNILESYRLEINPTFQQLNIKLSEINPLAYPDSVAVLIQHEKPQQYFQEFSSNTFRNGNSCYINARPAGKYYINVFKSKNAVTQSYLDSVVMTFDQAFTYTINY